MNNLKLGFLDCILFCRNVFLFLIYYFGSNLGRSIENFEKMVVEIGIWNFFLICIYNKLNWIVILFFWKMRFVCGKLESYFFKINFEKGFLVWLFVCNIGSKNIYI